MDATKTQTLRGGEFIVKESLAGEIFIPEEFNEEQIMMGETADSFISTEVTPNLDRIDAQEAGLVPSLLDKAGELGLLATAIPEAYGGFGKDFITNLLITEKIGAGHSFAVSLAAHTGIGTLPILYFGNEKQKTTYLPKLGSGELKASYCLTEPGSGSDALAAKTKAVLSADGKYYVLNGQKMWITNAGFADIFIVFAQVDGDKFTGFILERNYPGMSFGEEEHKMGIKGSSTRQVFFSDCMVPVENVLGEIGKGHLIAFNILNIGRAKLAAAALGACKKVCTSTIEYANQREQFKMPIAKFGAIRHKLAEQATRIYTLESVLYRIGELIDQKEKQMEAAGTNIEAALLAAADEYAIECAMLKVLGSEVLDYVVDEGVQVLGGYGFSADYPMDRAYRDSRINRIFEGTNEINRLLSVDMILKRAMKGSIDLFGPAKAIQSELTSIPDFSTDEESLFSAEKKLVKNMKKLILMTAGTAAQKYMTALAKEQEIIMNIADMMIETFSCESVLLRTEKLVSIRGEKASAVQLDMMRIYLNDSIERVQMAAKNAVASMSEGDEQRMLLSGLKRFSKWAPVNTKEARRRVSDALCEANAYCF